MTRFAMLPLLLLAACATPREQCISRATQDIRVLDRLIAQSQGTIERGYGYGTERFTSWQWGICGRNRNGSFRYCFEPEAHYRKVPVAVDLTQEQSRLQSMVFKRNQLAKELGPNLAACNATYPAQ